MSLKQTNKQRTTVDNYFTIPTNVEYKEFPVVNNLLRYLVIVVIVLVVLLPVII